MNKLMMIAGLALLLGACGKESGEVAIELPSDFKENTIVVSHITLDNIYDAKKQDDLVIVNDTLEVRDGKAVLALKEKTPTWYYVVPPVPVRQQPEFYAVPGDKLDVKITNFDPLEYDVKGSQLMEDIMAYYSVTNPIQMEYVNLMSASDSVSPDAAKAIIDRYDDAVKKFVADHPDSHAVPLVIQDLDSEDFKQIYDNLSAEAKKSILMPGAVNYNKEVEKVFAERQAEQARKDEVAAGKTDAPNFTLPDLNGKQVSLSDFRGKWVVLDFWGSWCGWCIKGFLQLKEAYKEYGDKIVVIGIDCNESEDEWREGVKKYQLPGLNLYNGNDQKIYQDYKIEGFPTKVIISPEGKLVDLTTGEDPEFFDRLAAFVK